VDTLLNIAPQIRLWRLAPLGGVALISLLVFATGWHRQLSFETLARHDQALRAFIAGHLPTALIVYVAVYTALVALSLPVGTFLTLVGGILFGTLLGGAAAVAGATLGAICIFLIARSALGEHLLRRAGRRAQALAQNFRADAFSYMLFLRLTPIFPFWLVNLVPAAAGVRLLPFAAATALGIVPLTFAYAFVGNSIGSMLVAEEAAYERCVAAGESHCVLSLRTDALLTPQLIAALAILAVLALLPVLLKHWRARMSSPSI
jgi:uncharacterized membrane protein YdjX (TVP38/TMEM64 family)